MRARRADCGPKAGIGKPAAASRQPEGQRPVGQLRQSQQPPGEGQSQLRPEGQQRQSRLPLLKINLTWARGRSQQSSKINTLRKQNTPYCVRILMRSYVMMLSSLKKDASASLLIMFRIRNQLSSKSEQ